MPFARLQKPGGGHSHFSGPHQTLWLLRAASTVQSADVVDRHLFGTWSPFGLAMSVSFGPCCALPPLPLFLRWRNFVATLPPYLVPFALANLTRVKPTSWLLWTSPHSQWTRLQMLLLLWPTTTHLVSRPSQPTFIVLPRTPSSTLLWLTCSPFLHGMGILPG